jgi:hypothetical protein
LEEAAMTTPRPDADDDRDLMRQVLKLMFDAAAHGMTRDELVTATGADPKAIDKILKRSLGEQLALALKRQTQ